LSDTYLCFSGMVMW